MLRDSETFYGRVAYEWRNNGSQNMNYYELYTLAGFLAAPVGVRESDWDTLNEHKN